MLLVTNLHGKLLAGETGSTFFLQRNASLEETLDQVHFSCRWLCWKM